MGLFDKIYNCVIAQKMSSLSLIDLPYIWRNIHYLSIFKRYCIITVHLFFSIKHLQQGCNKIHYSICNCFIFMIIKKNTCKFRHFLIFTSFINIIRDWPIYKFTILQYQLFIQIAIFLPNQFQSKINLFFSKMTSSIQLSF